MGHLSAVGGAPASKRLVALVAGFSLARCATMVVAEILPVLSTETTAHSDTEIQRPSQSARGLMRLCLTATKLKIAVRMATMEACTAPS
jgi:hypothetical protein